MSRIILLFRSIGNVLLSLFKTSNFIVELVDLDRVSTTLEDELKAFETTFTYPYIRTEKFRIEHGRRGDYFAFFKQLGKPYFYVVREKKNNNIAAVVCGVLRQLQTVKGINKTCWYVCDLKIGKEYQGKGIIQLLVRKVVWLRLMQCPRAYGINMNRTHSVKAPSIFEKLFVLKGLKTRLLNMYSLDADQLKESFERIQQAFIDNGYVALDENFGCSTTLGVKDYTIIDTKTGGIRYWHLFHIGPRRPACSFVSDATYMVCAVGESQLDRSLQKILGEASSSATIVSYGMHDIDFNCIRSDEI